MKGDRDSSCLPAPHHIPSLQMGTTLPSAPALNGETPPHHHPPAMGSQPLWQLQTSAEPPRACVRVLGGEAGEDERG